MLAGVFLVVLTVALFLYWFRYMCLVILRARTFRDYAAEVAAVNDMRFPQVRTELRLGAGDRVMRDCHQTLVEEYRLLVYLLRHAQLYEVPHQRAEMRMLQVDFQLMGAWYRVARLVHPPQARAALLEMAEVLHYIANTMGESSVREITDTGNIPAASL